MEKKRSKKSENDSPKTDPKIEISNQIPKTSDPTCFSKPRRIMLCMPGPRSLNERKKKNSRAPEKKQFAKHEVKLVILIIHSYINIV